MELSKVFVNLAQNTEKRIFVLEKICHRSMVPLVKKGSTIKFSERSCTLQIYAEFLNQFVAKNVSNTNEHLNMDNLMDITINTIEFICSCFTIPVKWLSNGCLCRLQIVKVCTQLIYLCLKYWMEKPLLIGKFKSFYFFFKVLTFI